MEHLSNHSLYEEILTSFSELFKKIVASTNKSILKTRLPLLTWNTVFVLFVARAGDVTTWGALWHDPRLFNANLVVIANS